MNITDVKSHVLRFPLNEKPGYSQMGFDRRTARIVEVITPGGIRGFGEAFGGGEGALGNEATVFIKRFEV